MEGISQTSKIDDLTRAHKELRKDQIFIVNYKFFKKLITKLFKMLIYNFTYIPLYLFAVKRIPSTT
jgi:hypothetical protein